MYANTSWYDHFMNRRNSLGSHLPNNERHKVPGDRWLIARGYYPFGDTVVAGFKYILSESMALLVPSSNKETTLRMCLGAFGINQINVADLQIPESIGTRSLTLVVTEPTPLLYHIMPMPKGKWASEAWNADASNVIIENGRHFSLPLESAYESPVEAFKALAAQIAEERTASQQRSVIES